MRRLAAELDRESTRLWWRTLEHRLNRGSDDVTIEIKGLGASVEAARAAIRRARSATARMNESGATLERTANEIAAVFEQHTSDLLREAQTLGNGSSEPATQSGATSPTEPPGGAAAQPTTFPAGR